MEEIKNKIIELLNEVKENPGTMFGILYPYILSVVVIIGLYYVSNIGDVAINESPAYVPDTTVATDLQLKEARTVPPVDILELQEPTEELLAQGKELYNKNCASCHNETGAGGGPASVGLNPAPRNFTSPDGWKNGRTISAIYTTLEEGIEGSSMISYNFLTPKERIEIAHYIRQEFMTNPPKETEADLAALNSLYNLSSGMKVPAQIPVSAAIELIINEYSEKEIKLENALNEINMEGSSNEVKLFKAITYNKELALSSLVNSNGWKSGEVAFFNFVVTNSTFNGFNSEIINLSNTERNMVFSYLSKLL